MTDLERRMRFSDLQEMTASKGYQWLQKMFNDQIKEEQESFLRVESDHERLEKQIRLKILHELRGWADEEISRFQSLEKMKK